MTNSAVETADVIVSKDVVETTIEHLTSLDRSSDKKTMDKMARRLAKEQPALLRFAAKFHETHGPEIGEATIFYCTLVWSMFHRSSTGTLHRITGENIAEAQEVVAQEVAAIEGFEDRPIHKRYPETLAKRQPHIYTKLEELLEEDVREDAITMECAEVIFTPVQVLIEAFDAAIGGRRPGERQGPIVRQTPKVGRNEPCPCGSGKKYKKCHGQS